MNFLDSFEDATRPDVPKKPWFGEVSMSLVVSIEMLNRVVDECIESGRYGLDLETTGLDNRVFGGETKDKIVGFCLAPDGKRGYYAPIRHRKGEEHNLPIHEVYACIRRLVETEAVAVFHNAKFDHEFLQFPGGAAIGEWDEPKTFDDTNLLGWIRNTRDKSLGLKHMSEHELGKEMIELEDLFGKDHKGKLDFSELDPSWEPCIWYACSDAICTLLLYEKVHPEVVAPDGKRSLGQEVTYNLEKMTLPATRWMERARIFVDQDRVAELTQLGQVELFQCLCDIYDFCNEQLGHKRLPDRDEHGNTTPGSVEPGWFRILRKKFVSDDPDYNINDQIEDCRQEAKRKNLDDLDAKGHFFNLELPPDDPDAQFPQKYDILSRQQIGPLFEELQIPDLNRTAKSDQVQTTQAEIERLDERHGHRYPFLPKIKRLGELQKALGTYLISLHRDVGPDGTLRANFKQTGTDTGRFTTPSSKNPSQDGGTKFPIHGTPATYDKKRPACLLGIRSAFRARPGRTMVAIDFGGVELRIATIYSGEPKWLREYFRCSTCGNEFNSGDGSATPDAPPAYCPKCGDDRIGDLHTLTGITFYGEDKVGTKAWKQMRQGAKSANFALAYGGGPSAIMRAIEGCSEQEAARHHRSFNETYSTLKTWWDEVKQFGRKRGYVETAFRRHYPIPDILLPTKFAKVQKQLLDEYPEKLAKWEKKYEKAKTAKQKSRLLEIKPQPPTEAAVKKQMEINRKFKAKAERNATNGPIQGLSADITKLAMALIYRECKKRGWLEKVYMIITIHDELVFEIEDDILAEAVDLFQDIMTRNKTILNMKWPVPLTTDCEIGLDWTVPWDIKDFKYQRVRPDGFQTDEKGRLYRDKNTGELLAKFWPEKFVKIFGPVYGFAPVVENLTEEEGKKFFGPEWKPLPLTEGATAPTQPLKAPEAPQSPQEPPAPPSPPTVAAAPETLTEAPAAAESPAPAPPTPPTPPTPPFSALTGQSSLRPGEVFEFRLRDLGIGVADKLAHVIVHCQGKGSHPLRVVGPAGERLPWPDASIMVNDVEFMHIAGVYGI
jgi:DNA polymerase I-like protein with 3'-5' exonuclease and polymerase domains